MNDLELSAISYLESDKYKEHKTTNAKQEKIRIDFVKNNKDNCYLLINVKMNQVNNVLKH